MKNFILGLMAIMFAIVTCFAFTKPGKASKTSGPYYFQVTNTVTPGNENSAVLAFPGSIPPTSVPTSWNCTDADVHDCGLGFSGYTLVGSQYKPSNTIGGTVIPQSSYQADLQASATKN